MVLRVNDIIKSLNYQIKRDNFTYYSVIIFLCVLIGGVVFSETYIENGGMFTVQLGSILPFGILFMFLVLTTRISGWDYNDKTINYELLSGHSRKESYFSRVILSLLWCITVGVVLSVVPVIVFSLFNGWGNNMEVFPIVLRFILALFPMVRIICEFILLTVIVENCYSAMVFGYILSMISSMIKLILEEFSTIKLDIMFGVANLTKLFAFTNYRMGFEDGKDIMLIDTELETSFIMKTIIVSVIVSIVCIFLGYLVFKKRDMR